MFHHFDWKLPIHGQIFRFLEVNRDQISFFSFDNPKSHIFAHSASFEPLRVTIRPGVSSLRWSEKKINKKVTQKVIFHRFAQKSPVNGFLSNLEQTFLSWT